jgi:hypothetical protein
MTEPCEGGLTLAPQASFEVLDSTSMHGLPVRARFLAWPKAASQRITLSFLPFFSMPAFVTSKS